MKKIPTIFERDWNGDRSRVLDKPHPDCAWVFSGEGRATRKLDGTSCLVRGGKLFKRYETKSGAPPEDFEEVQLDTETGKRVGWRPVGDGPEDKWHRQAWDNFIAGSGGPGGGMPPPDGTYELVGPKVQGNPEGFDAHTLMAHSLACVLPDAPRIFSDLRDWLSTRNIEGIVWHHPDGRMAKIKKRDFGLKRKP